MPKPQNMKRIYIRILLLKTYITQAQLAHKLMKTYTTF
jgi:hypothetical protein